MEGLISEFSFPFQRSVHPYTCNLPLVTGSFVMSFEIEQCESSNFVSFFFKLILASLDPLHLQLHFKISLLILAKKKKKGRWDFDKVSMESVDTVGMFITRI